jgi:hypothetical protein
MLNSMRSTLSKLRVRNPPVISSWHFVNPIRDGRVLVVLPATAVVYDFLVRKCSSGLARTAGEEV